MEDPFQERAGEDASIKGNSRDGSSWVGLSGAMTGMVRKRFWQSRR